VRSTLHPAWAVLAKVHAGVACVRSVFQVLVDRLTKSGLRQFVDGALMKTSLACSTLGSSAAMLTMVNSVKTLTKSVAVSLLDNQNRTPVGQGTWKCGLPAEVVDEDQTTLQEMMSLKRTPHTTLDGNHHNHQV